MGRWWWMSANGIRIGCGPKGYPMRKTTIRYFESEDILHIAIADDPESRGIELGTKITVELDENNEIIGVEILEASSFLRDAVLESFQARALRVLEAAGG